MRNRLTTIIFRICRHALVVAAFAVLSLGPSLYLLGDRIDQLGEGFILFSVVNAAALIACFYLNLYVITPQLLMRGSYSKYFSLLCVMMLVYIILKWSGERWLLSTIGVERSFNAVTLLDWASNTAMCVVCLLSCSAIVLFRQWMVDTRKIHDLETTRLQNRVDEFKERIDAPVLYRVLGYTAEKVKSDPAKVSEIIFRLSDRLRRQLYDDER